MKVKSRVALKGHISLAMTGVRVYFKSHFFQLNPEEGVLEDSSYMIIKNNNAQPIWFQLTNPVMQDGSVACLNSRPSPILEAAPDQQKKMVISCVIQAAQKELGPRFPMELFACGEIKLHIWRNYPLPFSTALPTETHDIECQFYLGHQLPQSFHLEINTKDCFCTPHL